MPSTRCFPERRDSRNRQRPSGESAFRAVRFPFRGQRTMPAARPAAAEFGSHHGVAEPCHPRIARSTWLAAVNLNGPSGLTRKVTGTCADHGCAWARRNRQAYGLSRTTRRPACRDRATWVSPRHPSAPRIAVGLVSPDAPATEPPTWVAGLISSANPSRVELRCRRARQAHQRKSLRRR